MVPRFLENLCTADLNCINNYIISFSYRNVFRGFTNMNIKFLFYENLPTAVSEAMQDLPFFYIYVSKQGKEIRASIKSINR